VGSDRVNAVVHGQSAQAALDSPASDDDLDTSSLDTSSLDTPSLDEAPLDASSLDKAVEIGVLPAAPFDVGEDDSDPDDADSDDTDSYDDPGGSPEPAEVTGDADTKIAAEGEPADTVARPTEVTETLAASALVPDVRPAASSWDADRVVTEIYHGEYKSLVRLAVLLVHDVPTAEEVVQDAFEAMHTAWRRLREKEKALSYLRQAVVNRSRSVLRHRTVVDRNAPKPAPDEPSAEHGALALIERSAVIAALRTLPDRQREAVVLRYYADLSEADIAATMGISRGAVKSHTARAMAALKSILELETS
jgi:RNA polymerase sigma-70 factor (sigma-E family)